jgi:hypothetical protein
MVAGRRLAFAPWSNELLQAERRLVLLHGASPGGALSSVEEHFLHTEGVAGSSPAARTIVPALAASASPLIRKSRDNQSPFPPRRARFGRRLELRRHC